MGQLVVVCMLCRIVGGPGPQCSLAWTFLRRRPRLRPEIDRHETCGHDGRQIIPGEGAQSDEIYRFRARNEHSAKVSEEAPNRAVSFLERQNKNLCYPNNLYPMIYALTLTSNFMSTTASLVNTCLA